MIGVMRLAGLDLPDAVATPTGAPDISTEACEAANAQLLWRALRETIRNSDSKAEPGNRDGKAGFLWRGNPALVAEALWDGLDGSPTADETLSALYAYLHRVRILTRVDTGNRGRQWWVADKWQPAEPDKPTAAAELRVQILPDPAVSEPHQPAQDDRAVAVAGEPDYTAALQGLLDSHAELKQQLKRALAMTSLSGGNMEDLSAEIIQLRGINEELRDSNRRLRAENTAYRAILEQPDDS